jgi:hypothetical protein
MDERRRDAFAIEEIGRIKNYTNLVDIHARVLSPLTARIVAPWIGTDR